MVIQENLTNEKLIKKFKSQFELVSYAIRLAENMIKTGRDSRVKTDIQNRALQILAEIAENKDRFDDIPSEKPQVAAEPKEYRDVSRKETSTRSAERKRKVFAE